MADSGTAYSRWFAGLQVKLAKHEAHAKMPINEPSTSKDSCCLRGNSDDTKTTSLPKTICTVATSDSSNKENVSQASNSNIRTECPDKSIAPRKKRPSRKNRSKSNEETAKKVANSSSFNKSNNLQASSSDIGTQRLEKSTASKKKLPSRSNEKYIAEKREKKRLKQQRYREKVSQDPARHEAARNYERQRNAKKRKW